MIRTVSILLYLAATACFIVGVVRYHVEVKRLRRANLALTHLIEQVLKEGFTVENQPRWDHAAQKAWDEEAKRTGRDHLGRSR